MMEQRSLKSSTAIGVLWLLLQSLGSRSLGFASQLILAALLSPSDFGKIGLAFTISGLTGAFVAFGIDDVILHRRSSIERWSSSAFYLVVTLGLIGLALSLIAGYIGSSLYGDPSLMTIVQIAGLAIPLGALSTIPSAHIRAAMKFKFLASYNLSETALSQVLTIALAALGAGAYSFVIPLPILACVKAVVFWYKCYGEFRIRKVRIRRAGLLLIKGAASAGERILTEAVAQCDYILLGLLTSEITVGVYFFAFKLSAQPVRTLAASFQNVLLAALAQLYNAPERQAQAAFRAARLLAFAVVPLCFLQAAIARPVLTELFGSKWQASITLVQVLSLGLPFDAVSWVVVAFLKARGEFKRAFLFSLLFAPIFIFAVAIGAWAGSALGAAIAVAFCYLLMPIFFAASVFYRIGFPVSRIAGVFLFPLLLAGPCVGAAYEIASLQVLAGHHIVQVIVILLLGLVLYLASAILLFPRVIIELFEFLPFGRRVLGLMLPSSLGI